MTSRTAAVIIIAIAVLIAPACRIARIANSVVDSVDDFHCDSEPFQRQIAELAANDTPPTYQIFTFDYVWETSRTRKKLWCQARVRTSMPMITLIEYTIEDRGNRWRYGVRPVEDDRRTPLWRPQWQRLP